MLENIKTKVKTIKFKTILSVVLYCTVLILAITLYQTYSAFRMSNSGNLLADTSGLICDISLDTSAEYVENDEAYFLLNIQNYRGNLTNGVAIGYKITITNQNGSNGLFRYVDSDGNSNDEYVATLEIPEHTFSTEKETETIKIYVKSSTNIEETVNYNVKLDAYQVALLYNKLLSEEYTLDTNVNFDSGSSTTNGIGLMMRDGTQNDDYPIVYYRGDVSNNNVIFADLCWLIVRTTETGGIKLVFNGPVVENADGTESCTNYSGVGGVTANTNYTDVFAGNTTTAFNTSSKSPVYVGYMYNDANKYFTGSGSSGTLDGAGYIAHLSDNSVIENGLDSETGRHTQNKTDSTVKGVVDAWYEENILGKPEESLLEDTVWCNDRSVISETFSIENYANGTNGYFYFAAGTRLAENTTVTPSLVCSRDMDKFTVDSANGNGDLDYPIGLLTADEINLAGHPLNSSQTTYLTSGGNQWSLSPLNFVSGYASSFFVEAGGLYGDSSVYYSFGARPSVSLGLWATFTSGDGSYQSPYRVG